MATPGTVKTYNLPTVVLIGRANVGKSTLFNKLIEENKALVSTIAGTTRTNNEGDVLWRATYLHLIDTGGPDTDENELFADEILAQAELALHRADILVFVTDAKTGILPQERELIRRLRQKTQATRTPILLVANKCDTPRHTLSTNSHEWLSLGLGEPMPVSAITGRGVGDFLDVVYTTLNKQKRRPKAKKASETETPIMVSLIGKPNVGKSSLFNKLIGEEKVIVSNVPHTTREPFDTTLTYEENNKKYTITFVDTAGIRRKSNVAGTLEHQGIQKSIESIERSDIILLVLDGSEPLSSQDMQLGGLIEKRSKSVIIVLNKWDLAEDTTDANRNDVKKLVYAHFPHLSFAPIILASGATGYRTHQIFPLLIEVDQSRKTTIPQATLDTFIKNVTRDHRPARGKGTRHPEIMGIHQINSAPPVFEMFIKYRTSLHRSYLHYVENRLREQFDFTGTPIVIKLTKMKR